MRDETMSTQQSLVGDDVAKIIEQRVAERLPHDRADARTLKAGASSRRFA